VIEMGALEIVVTISMLPLPFVLLWVAVVTHITLDKLECIFSESRLVKYNRDMLRGLGLPGKVIRCGAIFMMCMRPDWHESKGLLRRGELAGMTRRMKWTIYPPFLALSVLTVAAMISGAILRFHPT
jgi:hypothetical protein